MVLNLSLGKFHGIDSIIELLIILVSFIISYYSHKIYKVIKERNYKLLSWGFLAIGISFLFKILSNVTILHRIEIEKANFVLTIFTELERMEFVNFISFIFFKVFHIIGFLLLFFMITKTTNKEKMFLFTYLIIITILFSVYFNFIFYLTLVLIIAALTYNFYENYKKTRTSNTLLVFLAFLIMLISHVFFVFSGIHSIFYLSGEFLLLIGFLFLLINQIKIKNGQKKNKIGVNKRYLRNIEKRKRS